MNALRSMTGGELFKEFFDAAIVDPSRVLAIIEEVERRADGNKHKLRAFHHAVETTRIAYEGGRDLEPTVKAFASAMALLDEPGWGMVQ